VRAATHPPFCKFESEWHAKGISSLDATSSRTEATVTTRRRRLPPSLPLFVGLCTVVIAIKLLFAFYPGDFPIKQQAEAFGSPMIAMLIAIGLAGLFADRALGLPEPLTDRRREWRGVIWSVLTGFAYGVVTVTIDVIRQPRHVLSTGAAWDHVAWPWSVPFYLFGAIFLEFLLRLGALCILFWLVHVVVLRRRWRTVVFWIVAALVALYEIMPFIQRDIAEKHWDRVALSLLQPLYLSNVFEGWLLWRFGWLMPIVFRLAFYLVWHVLYGGLARPSA
jgi:hypothetical protein